MHSKSKLLIISFLLLITLCGCWDRIEIDQRGFVVGIAVDLAAQDHHQWKNGSSEDKISPHKKYWGTFQMVVPSGLTGGSSGNGKGGAGGANAFFNIAAAESSMPSLTAKISGETSRSPYFEHLELIVFSDDVAKSDSEFARALDYFLRDNQMRRNVSIFVADGKASDILDTDALNEKYPVAYISSLLKNTRKSNYILPETRLGDIHEHLLKKESFVVQRARKNSEGVSLTGAAVFNGENNQFVGFLSGEETQGLNFLTNGIKGGIVETQYRNRNIDLEVWKAERKIRADIQGQRPVKFTFQIQVTGNISKSATYLNMKKDNSIETMKKLFEDEIIRTTENVIHTLQNKYNKDVLGLGSYLYRHHYKTWKQVEDDWEKGEQLFSKIPVEVTVKVDINKVGSIINSERE